MTRAAVLGAGSWGTAFAQVLADAGTDTIVWARREEMATSINEVHENPDYLPRITLPVSLEATHDIEKALAGADLVVLAVPSQTLRANLEPVVDLLPRDSVLISLMKGVELGTDKRMTEVIREVADVPESRVVAVSGPNLAREIALREPAAAVVGCTDMDVARRVQVACNAGYFRPYRNHDVIGVEFGGAVKNVIALAVGMAAGLGFGDNARASMITRGLAETSRIGTALGAEPLTFSGLAGLGDLVATCSSPLSRNRTFGEDLGRGLTVEQVVAKTRQTAEGVKSCRSILDLAVKNNVAAPITEHVVKVVDDGWTVPDMMASLLASDPKHELDADV
ncbi:MAG: NAD(P)-dependent glycerol-3-phosphate dehydrogenase [Frankiaceae bacterium]|nr:NAD(P)-dependent glycerol-3-phosphate dehydrogenase [Frankiaceae bacterium]MBV9869376.1 NAD(P)-dependent glycerol-3-phosphate dehydrogenase [Frankiaceae bacterium]